VTRIWTIGHSTLALAAFTGLLDRHGIAGIIDVRRYPHSHRHPQFDTAALARALEASGRAYDWIPALGGRRAPRPDSPHIGWQVEQFRGYADHMETDEFARGLASLLAIAGERPTAVMCAEAVPWRCHRRLIADALIVRGVEVRNVLGAGEPGPHVLTPFARIEGTRIVYDRASTSRLLGL
jgi:uncharacterized protein (DUF488 family)